MTQIASAHRQFHLIDANAAPVDGRPVHVAVPDGVSRLLAGPNGQRLRCEAVSGQRSSAPPACLLEPLQHGNMPCLLVLAPDRQPVCVNGQRAARIACLQERDQLQLPDGRDFHVAVHIRCVIGRAPDAIRRRSCGVCRQPVGDRIVYLCPACVSPIHCDRRDPDEPLDCLAICSECPSCHASLARDGYAWVPEI